MQQQQQEQQREQQQQVKRGKLTGKSIDTIYVCMSIIVFFILKLSIHISYAGHDMNQSTNVATFNVPQSPYQHQRQQNVYHIDGF